MIGSTRIKFPDYLTFMNESHLQKFLKELFHYDNNPRIHPGLKKDSPVWREVRVIVKIKKVSVVNGLYNNYIRIAA
jgi:hypothetical protein